MKISDEFTRVSANAKVRKFSLALLLDNGLGAHGWTGRLSFAITICWEVKYIYAQKDIFK